MSSPSARILLSFVILVFAYPAAATTVIPAADPGEEARHCDAVVFVRAGSSRPVARSGMLSTVTEVEVLSVVSGSLTVGEIAEVLVPGGATDGMGWAVEGSPRLAKGQDYLIFAGIGLDGRLRPRLLADSVLRRELDSKGAAVLVPMEEARGLKRLGVATPGIGMIPAPVDEKLFLEQLHRSLAGELGWEWDGMMARSAHIWKQLKAAPNGCAILSYEGTPIRWETFDNGGSASISADSTGDVTFEGGGFDQVQNAVDRWMGIGGTNLNLEYAGTKDYTLTCVDGEDGSNPNSGDDIVVFNDPCDEIDDLNSCSGTLAFGGPWFGAQHAFDGETWYTAGSWFVVANNGLGNCLSLSTFELVITHELGHGLGFGHTDDSSSLMFANCCAPFNGLDVTCTRYLYPSAMATIDGVTVPVIASINGVDGTPWRSEVTIANPTNRSAVLEMTYQPAGGSEITVSRSLPGSSTLIFPDIVGGLFGSSDGKGPLRVLSNDTDGEDPVIVTRTYAQQSFGNLGSGLPSDQVPGADTVSMPGLVNDMWFRSNVSVTAGSGADVSATFELFRSNEGLVGSGVQRTVTAGEQGQWRVSELFPNLGYSALPMTVRVTMDQAGIANATVIDNSSTDSAVVLGKGPSSNWTVPVAAREIGKSGSPWTSELSLWNASGGPVVATIEYHAENDKVPGGPWPPVDVQLDAFETVRIDDVLLTLFAVVNGTGSLAIEASGSITASSRVSTAGPNGGTSGNGVRTVTSTEWSNDKAVLPGVRMLDDYRTNVGLVTGNQAMSFNCKLLNGNGVVAAETTVTVAARSMRHLSVEELFGSGGYNPPNPVGTIVVEGDGTFLAYLTVIDGSSEDPIFVMPR